ncbi:MAG: hypothetical protein EAZ99_19480 [Alphaproteobacteria bacterium]|nr:MAG: hypothetical protein EAZ99_19480 [Alphaproteobacteria bacterium]
MTAAQGRVFAAGRGLRRRDTSATGSRTRRVSRNPLRSDRQARWRHPRDQRQLARLTRRAALASLYELQRAIGAIQHRLLDRIRIAQGGLRCGPRERGQLLVQLLRLILTGTRSIGTSVGTIAVRLVRHVTSSPSASPGPRVPTMVAVQRHPHRLRMPDTNARRRQTPPFFAKFYVIHQRRPLL